MLPVSEILDDLTAVLRAEGRAVLVAPPGAGKTTLVPLALVKADWASRGKIIMLEPRRLAARAAARRMAQLLDESVGETIGYRVRMDSRTGPNTRVEVVTEGVLTRMLQDDPALEEVACVIFDEFHERSLQGDLGLVLTFDMRGALRPDLRVLVMSATLDGARVSALLDDAPLVESQGRAFPVETRYLGRDPAARIEDQVVRAVLTALREETGSLLVFLPGAGEIKRVRTRLRDAIDDPAILLAPLYGAMEGRAQDAAIAPAAPGSRKVVLATTIAETSLTIEGVRVVIDCGLSRVPRFEPGTGLTRLETVRVARTAADQRRGRAGRTEPGVCYRLWAEAETRGLVPCAKPEILEADLAPLALDLALWGTRNPADLAWFDPPPKGAWDAAVELLTGLGALDGAGALTDHGRALAKMPMHPRLAEMLETAPEEDRLTAALLAALLGEVGLGGRDVDARERLRRFQADKSARAHQARAQADRWSGGKGRLKVEEAGLLLAHAYPDRVAQNVGGGRFRLANGRQVRVEETDALAGEDWLAVAELIGSRDRARILLAAPLTRAEIEQAFEDRIEVVETVEMNAADGKVRAERQRRLGALILGTERLAKPSEDLITRALVDQVRRQGLGCLPFSKGTLGWRDRVMFLRQHDPDGGWPDQGDAALVAQADDWLPACLTGFRRLADVPSGALDGALRALVPWGLASRIDAEMPSHFTAPTGTRVAIDYAAEGGPAIAIRVQELFGLTTHPAIAGGRVPLALQLLSPAHRPFQVTRDLPGFWQGSWADVRKDMKARYPKHPWPEDPASADATRRAKPRRR